MLLIFVIFIVLAAIYNVYDLIISPEVSGAWQVAKWLWSKYQGIEYQTKTRSIALMAYLKTHEEKLLDLNAESPLDILQYNMEVSDVLSSLSYTYYCSGTRYEVDLSHTNNSCYLVWTLIFRKLILCQNLC